MTIEYDGSRFHGWQKQPALRTIQGELHRVLEIILRESIHCVHSAGRTDSGVHARGQVIGFVTSKEPELVELSYSVTSLLKGEVAVRNASFAPENFHPRRGVVEKCYTYHLFYHRMPPVLSYGQAWHIASPLDLTAMERAAKALIGEHDFTSFRAAGCQAMSPVKSINDICFEQDHNAIRLSFRGKGFLKQMVRILVGTLVEVGRGARGADSIPKLLAARDRRMAGKTAPPHGLFLDWVRYQEDLYDKELLTP